MKKQFDITFHVKILQAGQERPFADTRHLYEIESLLPAPAVKRFCTRLLHPCRSEEDQTAPLGTFHSRYRFERIGKDRYRYLVTLPYTD